MISIEGVEEIWNLTVVASGIHPGAHTPVVPGTRIQWDGTWDSGIQWYEIEGEYLKCRPGSQGRRVWNSMSR